MAVILVIDDDADMRTTMERILRSSGHDVICANNGRDGLAVLDTQLPDLIVTDIFMPEIEGIETIIAARRLGRKMGIIAVSGGGGMRVDFLSSAERLGADRVLPKPFHAAELIETVNAVLNGLSKNP